MINIKVNNLELFENFLVFAGKFVQQGELIFTNEKTVLYCKNTQDFAASRLLLETNAIYLDEHQKDKAINSISICLSDLTALRSCINIIHFVENKNECILKLDEVVMPDGTYKGKVIYYTGQAKFKLIAVDFQIIEKYISKDLTDDTKKALTTHDWSFNIIPANLDLMQNKTSNIVDTQNDVSIYLYPDVEQHLVIVDLASRKSPYINSIAVPIANKYEGNMLNETTKEVDEVAIHESSFRLFNILKVSSPEKLFCFFNKTFNLFVVESSIEIDNLYINSQFISQIIKGK